MNKAQVIQALSALAHPTRLDVFRALVVAGHGGVTPGVLIEQLGVSSANLSFHLKELSIAGLASQERSGRNIVYRAAYDKMDHVIGYLTANCCKGAAASTGLTRSASCSSRRSLSSKNHAKEIA